MTRNQSITSPLARGRVSSDSGGEREAGGGEKSDVQETRPMYVFTPVDRYGDNKEETKPLEDHGIITLIQCMHAY